MPNKVQNPYIYQFAYSHVNNWLEVANIHIFNLGSNESTIEKESYLVKI